MKRYILTISVLVMLAAVLAVAVRANDPETVDPDRTLGVVYGDQRATEDVPLYRLARPSEELFISAYDLARIFRATRYWNAGARKLILRIESHSFMLTIDTRVVVVDDEPVLMRIPVAYANGSVMIPLEFVSNILAPMTLEEVELDEERLVLTIGSPRYNITSVDFEKGEEGTRAVMTLTEELLYHVDSETPGLLRLKVYGGRLNALKINATEGLGLFNRVRAEQTEHDSYLFFDVEKTAESFRVEFIGPGLSGGDGRKLVIHLEKGELPEIPEVDFAGRRMTEILDDSRRAARRDIVRVAIDAGHGGIDKGKVGPTGLMEKEVNLDIAMMLRDLLVSDYGMEVVMTRTEDVLVPLMRRAEIANREGADIFVSLHCNGWFHPDAGGYETFFLSQAKTEEATRLAMEENASIQFEGTGVSPEELDDLGFMLWDMVQNEFVTESSELAELIQRELGEVVDIRNRGVKQAGLIVLKGCRMPAVLVEAAFLSNPGEERLLADKRFREEIARGIAEAIRRYRARYSGASAREMRGIE
jgi:N-acetylmuramoyl-L-alanine amidase